MATTTSQFRVRRLCRSRIRLRLRGATRRSFGLPERARVRIQRLRALSGPTAPSPQTRLKPWTSHRCRTAQQEGQRAAPRPRDTSAPSRTFKSRSYPKIHRANAVLHGLCSSPTHARSFGVCLVAHGLFSATSHSRPQTSRGGGRGSAGLGEARRRGNQTRETYSRVVLLVTGLQRVSRLRDALSSAFMGENW